MRIKEVFVKDYISESNLPDSDYVINPYIGCSNACKYCYACFMKRFTKHSEEWGKFVDVKYCSLPLKLKRLENKKLFLGSVTDCYNVVEKDYEVTKKILLQLVNASAKEITLSTKSDLILRDIEILKNIKNLTVSFSINTHDEKFRADMDNASTIENRVRAMKILHDSGIRTVCFMSPIFPEITNYKAIIEMTKGCCDEYWFENLNLRAPYKNEILTYINNNYIGLTTLYDEIYNKQNKAYWKVLAEEIKSYCEKENLRYKIYFFHEDIKKDN